MLKIHLDRVRSHAQESEAAWQELGVKYSSQAVVFATQVPADSPDVICLQRGLRGHVAGVRAVHGWLTHMPLVHAHCASALHPSCVEASAQEASRHAKLSAS